MKSFIEVVLAKENLKKTFHILLKWGIICIISSIFTGSISAFFLTSLNWVTAIRNEHPNVILGLPIAGLLIGIWYYYWGKTESKGNNLLIDTYYRNGGLIPLRMAPMVLVSTLMTHLFGGSAGREGTAVQIGSAITDQFQKIFNFTKTERRILISVGISGGFASVFGTPLAGTIFGMEVLILGKKRLFALIPCLINAYLSNWICSLWSVAHTHYPVTSVLPNLDIKTISWILLAGVFFGLAAFLFSFCTKIFAFFFKKITYPPFRTFIGGCLLVIILLMSHEYAFIGLGIPKIQEAFHVQAGYTDFFIKIIFTTLTLSAGFKGGEVTPLFFIGATLGSALSAFIPLPMDLLAAIGFIAVFAGASNTPIACMIMGLELFGFPTFLFSIIACITAYFFSGKSGIYGAQKPGIKHKIFLNMQKLFSIK